MERLFVYGTLRYGKFQKECWGRVIPGSRATLPDHERNRILIGGRKYYVMYQKQGAEVRGLVLPVTREDLRVGDIYEEKYNRRKVRLSDGSMAWTYLTKAIYLGTQKRTP
ncbi:MAG: gamma-glutamylcyclotransferase family protein [Bacillota bacterium]